MGLLVLIAGHGTSLASENPEVAYSTNLIAGAGVWGHGHHSSKVCITYVQCSDLTLEFNANAAAKWR